MALSVQRTSGFALAGILLTLTLLVTFGFFRNGERTVAPSMTTSVTLEKTVTETAFEKAMSDAVLGNLTSPERTAGFNDGSDPLAQKIFHANYQQWVTADGTKQVYLYYDNGHKALSTEAGRKKRYDYWTGYVAAIRTTVPDSIVLEALPCREDSCPISVDWSAYTLTP